MADCIFCEIVRRELPAEKVYESVHCMGILDKNPAESGHILLIPRRHIETFADLLPEEAQDFFHALSHLQSALRTAFSPRGILTLSAEGLGQGVKHLHFHIVPQFRAPNILTHRKGYADDYERVMAGKALREALSSASIEEERADFLMAFTERMGRLSIDLAAGNYDSALGEFMRSFRFLSPAQTNTGNSLESLKTALQNDPVLSASFIRHLLIKEGKKGG